MSQQDQPNTSITEEAIHDLTDLGRMWASHGIRIGVAALQTSAVSLTQVASLLGSVANELNAKRADVDKPE